MSSRRAPNVSAPRRSVSETHTARTEAHAAAATMRVATRVFIAWTFVVAKAATTRHLGADVTQMNADLRHVPVGSAAVLRLNLAHNLLRRLDNYTFLERGYRNVQTIHLFRNAIARVGVDAFRDLRHLQTLDLSDNRLATLPRDAFASNAQLRELLLANNRIRFERQTAFVRSRSLRTLSLVGNDIAEVHAATFVGLANLRRLLLADNPLTHLAPLCFRGLRSLRYLSVEKTGVQRIDVEMFFAFPRLVRVAGTPFADAFRPPLVQLTNQSFAELARFDQAID